MKRAGVFLTSLLLSACAGDVAPVQARPVPPGALGYVGEQVISTRLLDPVGGTRLQAWHAVQRDLLFSEEQALRAPVSRGVIERGLLGRRLLQSLSETAAEAGEPTPRELTEAREQLWLEVDRPRAVSTVDAFIPVASLVPDASAYALAEKLHASVLGSESVERFAERAQQLERGALELRLVRRPPMSEDGRVVPLGPLDLQLEPLDADVARAAAALQSVGEVSPIVGGRDGFHVLYCTSIDPGVHLAEPQLAERLRPLVMAERARPELERIKQRLRSQTRVTIAAQQGTLTRLVWQERE